MSSYIVDRDAGHAEFVQTPLSATTRAVKITDGGLLDVGVLRAEEMMQALEQCTNLQLRISQRLVRCLSYHVRVIPVLASSRLLELRRADADDEHSARFVRCHW